MKKFYLRPLYMQLFGLFMVVQYFVGILTVVLLIIESSFYIGLIFLFIILFWYVMLIYHVCIIFIEKIQIDYDKKEIVVYQLKSKKKIFNSLLKSKIKFEDIISIDFIEYNDVKFTIIINEKTENVKVCYEKYYNTRNLQKIEEALDLKKV